MCEWMAKELRCTSVESNKYGEALIKGGSLLPLNCTRFVDKLGSFYTFSVQKRYGHLTCLGATSAAISCPRAHRRGQRYYLP
jgi:hypothetical protein